MSNSGIYMIVNLVNNKFYVGSAKNFTKRWAVHISLLNKNKHHNRHLQFAWNIYNRNLFKFYIVEYCSINNLIEREQHWLDKTKAYLLDIGYNTVSIAGNTTGYKFSKESIEKMKSKLRGIKHTEEAKRKMSLSRKGKKTRPHSEETKLKMSLVKIGKKPSAQAIINMSKAQKGKKYSKETREKIGKIHKKADIWPHEKGFGCKCDECLKIKNERRRIAYATKKKK